MEGTSTATAAAEAAATTVQFKTPPPFVSMRRSRIFVTKLRELSKAHVGEHQQTHPSTSASNNKRDKKIRFRPIKTILDWAEGTELLTCSGAGGPCKAAVAGVFPGKSSNNSKTTTTKQPSPPQQQQRVTSLRDERSLREFIFGADAIATSPSTGAATDQSDSSGTPTVPSFADDSAWTTDDDNDLHHHLDSSLYTTDRDEDEFTFDDATTISTWADESHQ